MTEMGDELIIWPGSAGGLLVWLRELATGNAVDIALRSPWDAVRHEWRRRTRALLLCDLH
jgi:hypothetical protein